MSNKDLGELEVQFSLEPAFRGAEINVKASCGSPRIPTGSRARSHAPNSSADNASRVAMLNLVWEQLVGFVHRVGKANFLAGLIGALVLAAPLLGNKPYPAAIVGILILPLACIWFGEAMGDFAGGARITQASAGPVVRLVGWLFLLLIAGVAVAAVLAS